MVLLLLIVLLPFNDALEHNVLFNFNNSLDYIVFIPLLDSFRHQGLLFCNDSLACIVLIISDDPLTDFVLIPPCDTLI